MSKQSSNECIDIKNKENFVVRVRIFKSKFNNGRIKKSNSILSNSRSGKIEPNIFSYLFRGVD